MAERIVLVLELEAGELPPGGAWLFGPLAQKLRADGYLGSEAEPAEGTRASAVVTSPSAWSAALRDVPGVSVVAMHAAARGDADAVLEVFGR